MSLKNSIGFQSLLNSLKDAIKPLEQLDTRRPDRIDYSFSDVVLSNFAMMYFQDESMLQFQKRMQEEYQCSNLQNLFGVENIPTDSTMRTILDEIDTSTFSPVFSNIVSKLVISKTLSKFAMLKGKYLCALDGVQYQSSKKISCKHCLTKTHRDKVKTYSHQALVPAIVNPKLKEVLPLMPEQIRNEDGTTKQDCEINAAKRLIPKLKQYDLPLIIIGDALYANQNMIELVQGNGFSYIFTMKSESFLDRIKQRTDLKYKMVMAKNVKYCYEWVNQVSLNLNKKTIFVNYFSLKTVDMKTGEIVYYNSWITDLEIDDKCVEACVEVARSRWKVENECFNTLKNHGYEMEHNYGHGEKYLAANYFLMTLLAHLFHQIHQLVDKVYQQLRMKKGALVVFWRDLKAVIKIIIFDSWDQLINYLLRPPRIHVSQLIPA